MGEGPGVRAGQSVTERAALTPGPSPGVPGEGRDFSVRFRPLATYLSCTATKEHLGSFPAANHSLERSCAMRRFSSFVCAGLLAGLLAPLALGQTPVVERERFDCIKLAIMAVPRLTEDLKAPDEKVRARAL